MRAAAVLAARVAAAAAADAAAPRACAWSPPRADSYLAGWASGGRESLPSLAAAERRCEELGGGCGGVTAAGGAYSPRKSTGPLASKSGETSWVKQCSGPAPAPAPTPAPPPTPPPPPPPTPVPGPACPGGHSRNKNCTTAGTTCAGQHPPFGKPARPVRAVDDWHYPAEEPAEAAALAAPALVAAAPGAATLRRAGSAEQATVPVGGHVWDGWQLAAVLPAARAGGAAAPAGCVVERRFARWSAIAFLDAGAAAPRAVARNPVGRLDALRQPMFLFNETDPEWQCKMDVDPTDWVGRVAADMSDGETTFAAAASVMAPNPDVGIFGNPEELNKWVLTDRGVLQTMGRGAPPEWPPRPAARLTGARAPAPLRGAVAFSVAEHLPAGCPASFPHYKAGVVGRYLRALSAGMWDPDTRCGAEVVAVSPPADASAAESVALLRVVAANRTGNYTAFFRARAGQANATVLGVDDLAGDGAGFYAALAAQAARWDPFVAGGAVPALPAADRRYGDAALALVTAYLNTDRGPDHPEYGGGKFWNLYNEYLPLDTLALSDALLAWGQHATARVYLAHFFRKFVNATTGKIIYGPPSHTCPPDQPKCNFGCDSDADYGRLIQKFCQAATHSGDTEWAQGLLPVVEAMAGVLVSQRAAAELEHPSGHVLHGIVRGSPEHDICGGRGHFFSVNAWHVRGLLELGALLTAFPSLTHNRTLESALLPTAAAWRAGLNAAANFTTVRRAGGGPFFLHPCVGSDCSGHTTLNLRAGGGDADCEARGTCFTSMTADFANQLQNYANFRIFSETLLAGVLDPEYEEAIMSYREAHRGTLSGMTRFRDVVDDMPILGYGWAALSHGRLGPFHSLLAGHSASYITRGTFWGTEQRQTLGVSHGRWRNDCGTGGEYCSLCMVSSVAASMWVRWMLLQEAADAPYTVHIARGAPRRWYQTAGEPFGAAGVPTRSGAVSYSVSADPASAAVSGWVAVRPNPGAAPAAPGGGAAPFALHLRAARAGLSLRGVAVTGGALVALHPGNETAVVRPAAAAGNFSFTATFH